MCLGGRPVSDHLDTLPPVIESRRYYHLDDRQKRDVDLLDEHELLGTRRYLDLGRFGLDVSTGSETLG